MQPLNEKIIIVDENGNPALKSKKEEVEVICSKCGNVFLGTKYRSVCFNCQREVNRKRQRENQAKYRKKYYERNEASYWVNKNL